MNVSVILAHPAPGSFNHAIAKTVIAELQTRGHMVAFHDLYREGFDPLLPSEEIAEGVALTPLVGEHCQEIARTDGIVVIHPNWWVERESPSVCSRQEQRSF
jgi:NAD(P)H dehydrogenase (quinone)